MAQIPLSVVSVDGDVKTTVMAQTAERADEIRGDMTNGEVVMSRAHWQEVDDVLDRRSDELVVEDPRDGSTFLAGRFDDLDAGDGDATVSIVGFERDANDSRPTGANVIYQNVPDSDIVTDLIDSVPTLSPGTIETVAPALSMSFSHSNPSKALRDVEEAAGGELRYNDDRTVDYVERRGEDKPGVVLSPGERTIVDDLSISEDAREEVTHIRGFGAQSGPDQVVAEAVADSYEAGERQIWSEYENKDIKQQSRLQRIVDQLANEYDGEPQQIEVEVSTTLDISLGDRPTVTIPEENLDRQLRVLGRTSTLGSSGAVITLTLSNRLLSRERGSSQKARRDLQRFNRGYQGVVGRDNLGAGNWQLVGDDAVAQLPYRYPDDVEEEISVTLDIEGRAWRSPVTPQAHDHSVSIGSHSHSVDIPSHQHDVSFTVPNHMHSFDTTLAETSSSEGHVHYVDTILEVTGVSDASSSTETSGSGGATTETTSSGGATTTTTDDVTPLSPAITTSFQGNTYYPEVDILVDGTTVATAIGDATGSWHTTLDTELEGVLTSGRNTITAKPVNGTRGEVMLALTTELFRRGRERDNSF